MNKRSTARYCVDPKHIRALHHEGIGWGHDLDCGCFEIERLPRKTVFQKLWSKVKGDRS